MIPLRDELIDYTETKIAFLFHHRSVFQIFLKIWPNFILSAPQFYIKIYFNKAINQSELLTETYVLFVQKFLNSNIFKIFY